MAFFYRNPHEQSLVLAQEEFANLEEERRQLTERLLWIEKRSKHLENYMQAIQPLIDEDPGLADAEAGLTHMCRELLMKNSRWIAAGEMRALLYAAGIDLKPY